MKVGSKLMLGNDDGADKIPLGSEDGSLKGTLLSSSIADDVGKTGVVPVVGAMPVIGGRASIVPVPGIANTGVVVCCYCWSWRYICCAHHWWCFRCINSRC